MVDRYLDFFRDCYLIEELLGWDAPIRSKKHLRTKPKRYFVDPSLAVAALGADKEALLRDFQTFGIMFENMCLHDLRVYLSAIPEFDGAQLQYYRDDTGLEADAIVRLPDQKWGAFEVKLSEDKVEEGIGNLLKLERRVRENAAARIPPASSRSWWGGRRLPARPPRASTWSR